MDFGNAPLSGHPPRARLAIRVGVSGHRYDKLDVATLTLVRASIRDVLDLVCRIASDVAADATDAYLAGAPIVRVVSALAEGADRIVAHEALSFSDHVRESNPPQEITLELQCALPFERTVYEQEFISTSTTYADAVARDAFWNGELPTSSQEFNLLLDQATAVMELDGSRNQAAAAYEAVGGVIVSHSDLLIAIWDGQPGGGRGGTENVIQMAIKAGVPVVWIPAQPPHTPVLLLEEHAGKQSSAAIEAPAASLRDALLPPVDAASIEDKPAGSVTPAAYFAEVESDSSVLKIWRWIGLWNLLRNAAARRPVAGPWASTVTTAADIEQHWACTRPEPRKAAACGSMKRSVDTTHGRTGSAPTTPTATEARFF